MKTRTTCTPTGRRRRPAGTLRARVALGLLALVVAPACGAEAGPDASGGPSRPGSDEGAVATLERYRAEPVDREAVLSAVQRLFDALESGDEALLRSVLHPTVVMHFGETRDSATSFGSSTVDALATRITTSPARLVERMWDAVVLVDGPLATVWTPYDFYAGAAFSHCGVDVATLLQEGGTWRIVGLSWTRRQPPDCGLHPEGPPPG